MHEFGHFATAKFFKVRVNEFAIGMGPALFKKRIGEKAKFFPQLIKEKKQKKKNDESDIICDTRNSIAETEYSMRMLPIGGYCALEGENGNSDDPAAFINKAPWKRFIILAAGATLNILFGLLLISAMLLIDDVVLTNEISYVSPAVEQTENSLLVGDKIIKVDGTRVYSSRDLSYCLFYRGDTEGSDLTVKRNGETIIVENFVYDDSDEKNATYFAITKEYVSLLNCGAFSVKECMAMGKLVFLSLLDMLGGQYGLDDLSGPIGTVNIVAETTTAALSEKDYSGILFLLAFITVNIGIVNLLPLPALDGGRIFFVIIEMIIRKPVPQKFEAVVHAIGMILLLTLMALISFNDIKNLIVN